MIWLNLLNIPFLRNGVIAGAVLVNGLVSGSVSAQDIVRYEIKINPTVVELFTSQGCSSCPPADQYLLELRDQPDVLPLSFHVDYWNYIGWDDPFSVPFAAQRQQEYSAALMKPYVYTPQIVAGGQYVSVGSKPADVQKCIGDAKEAQKIIPDSVDASAGIRLAEQTDVDADIWQVLIDYEHKTTIKEGENQGKVVRNGHVVRTIEKVGDWQGQAKLIPWPQQQHYGVVYMVHQRDPNGLGHVLLTVGRFDKTIRQAQLASSE